LVLSAVFRLQVLMLLAVFRIQVPAFRPMLLLFVMSKAYWGDSQNACHRDGK
jgi:hypothetical protein